MTLEQLEAYRANRVELKIVEDELENCKVAITTTSSAKYPYNKRYVPMEGLPPTPQVKELIRKQSKLAASCNAVERFIENIEDDKLRTAFRMRFQTPVKHRYLEIAFKLGYRDEGTPRKSIRQYLQNSD